LRRRPIAWSIAEQISRTRIDPYATNSAREPLSMGLMFAGLRMDTIGLPGSVLADLYIRLRDEIDGGERNLDPNHKLRAPIAMAILAAAENFGTDAFGIETQVRQSLGLAAHAEPAAA